MPRKQPTKNANGEGSTRWNAQRQRYEHRIVVGWNDNGTPIRRMATGKTKADLAVGIKRLTETVEVNPTAPVSMTVAQWFDTWFTDILPLERSSIVNQHQYHDRARLYVLPYVGAIQLQELKPAHVRKMITALRNKGLSGTTQQHAKKTLHRALNVAMAEGYVTQNVAALVETPANSVKKGRTLTPDEATQLLAYLHGHEHGAPIALLLMTGMRPGELGGLTWNDVDLERGRLWIRRTLHKAVKGNPEYVTDDIAKTDRSIRGVPLSGYLVDVLRRHRIKQSAERLAFGPGWGIDFPEHDFMFTRAGGSPINLDTLRHRLGDITVDCGLGKWNPYDLRHSAISLLAAMGYSSKMISELVGNSPRIADEVYTHTFEDFKVSAMDAFGAAIAPNVVK